MDDYRIDITAHGAVGDGRTLATAAIQAAVDAIGARGGGTVFVPPGTWLTGTVFLRDGVTLELHPAARLLGSPTLADYAENSWGQHIDRTPWHLLVCAGVRDVTITGGTIDGNGPAFWEDCEPGPQADPAAAAAPGAFRGMDPLTVVPTRHADPARAPIAWIRADKERRPSPMLEITDCRNVRIERVHLTNSAGWTLHLHNCDRVWVTGVELTSNLVVDNLMVTWPEVDAAGTVACPVDWRFPLKAANGMFDTFFERAEFTDDRLPPFSLVWARGVRGGSLAASTARPGGDAPRYDLADCALEVRD